jgi:hypothetical protein
MRIIAFYILLVRTVHESAGLDTTYINLDILPRALFNLALYGFQSFCEVSRTTVSLFVFSSVSAGLEA